jgi:1,4-dihydroxy-2-naphthoate octaprenyltransferase
MKPGPSTLSIFIRYARPVMLTAGVVFYFLGVGIAKYLGQPINWTRFWLGLALVLLLQLMSYLLKAYYDLVDIDSPLRRMQKDDIGDPLQVERNLPRQHVLLLAASAMTAGAATMVLLFSIGATNAGVLIFIGISLLLSYFYAVPPLRLVYNGYGELTEAILVTILFPGLAFLLQTGDLHRLLAMITFPLLLIFLAARMALSLEKYPINLKYGQKTMMIVLGWQRGMRLHNWLVPGAYLMMALAFGLGLPWSLTWPGLLPLPIGLFEIFQINQISAGVKPRWRLLNFTAVALLGLTVYFITLALWTR